MKKIGSLILLLSIPLSLFGGLWFVTGPLHDWQGKRNTQYSSKFSPTAFAAITNGMPLDTVTNLLGVPFQTVAKDDYPAWAVRTDKFRKEFGNDAKIRIEWLYFSGAQNPRVDFDLIDVVFGPDRTVIDKQRWVTD